MLVTWTKDVKPEQSSYAMTIADILNPGHYDSKFPKNLSNIRAKNLKCVLFDQPLYFDICIAIGVCPWGRLVKCPIEIVHLLGQLNRIISYSRVTRFSKRYIPNRTAISVLWFGRVTMFPSTSGFTVIVLSNCTLQIEWGVRIRPLWDIDYPYDDQSMLLVPSIFVVVNSR